MNDFALQVFVPRFLIGWAAIAASVTAQPSIGVAAALDPATCQTLFEEHAGLIDPEMREDLKRGPEWAKANLAAERLEKLAKVIELEEALAFRCPKRAAEGNLIVRLGPKPKKPQAVEKPVTSGLETGSVRSSPAAAPTRPAPAASRAEPPNLKKSDVYVPPPPGLGYRPGAYGQ